MAGGKGGYGAGYMAVGGAGGTGYSGDNGTDGTISPGTTAGGGGGGASGGGTGGTGGGYYTAGVGGTYASKDGQDGASGSGSGGGGGYSGLKLGDVLGSNTRTIKGGDGGAGGSGNQTLPYGGGGGGGGAGGYGVVSGDKGTVSNTSTITGGKGGAGGAAAYGPSGVGGVGGAGGDGGVGIFFQNSFVTFTNQGTVAGGHGGAGAGYYGATGAGGAGIVGENLTVINTSGTIKGGMSGDGTTRGDAIDFTGGTNSLTPGGTLDGGLGVDGATTSLTINAPAGGATLGNAITGAGSVTFTAPSDSDTITLTGDSTYSGGTTIAAATLAISADDNLGDASGNIAMTGGSTLDITPGTNGLDTPRSVTISGSETIEVASSICSIDGVISNGASAGTLTLTGGGIMVLSNANNSYSGGTVLDNYLTLVATDGDLGAKSGNVTMDNSFLSITGDAFSSARGLTLDGPGDYLDDDNGNATWSGDITGGGGLNTDGRGSITLSGDNSYLGGTQIYSKLIVSKDVNLGAASGALYLDTGGPGATILDMTTGFTTARDVYTDGAGTIEVDKGTGEIDGVVSDNGSTAGSLIVAGAGKLILTGTDTYTGSTTISAGTLQLGDGGTTGSIGSSSSVTDNATLAFDRTDSSTFALAISGNGSLAQNGSGTITLSADNTYFGGSTISSGTLDLASVDAAGSGTIAFTSTAGKFTGRLELASSAQPTANGGGTFANTLGGFSAGNVIVLDQFEALGPVEYNASTSTLTVQGFDLAGSVSTSVTESYKLSDPGATTFMAQQSGDNTLIEVTCFASGTLIRTVRGDIAVEALAVGDLVVTASGAQRPVTWLGHRTIDCRRHPRPREAMPVRIRAHAFGQSRPASDLFLSPGHSVCVDLYGEVLIPVGRLANGATIAQLDVDQVTYWHVELDAHDIVLAENLPCESYIDCGTRAFFAESDVVDLAALPDGPAHTIDDYCRPFHPEGALVDFARERLCLRANDLGWRLEVADPLAGLWLEVDGQRVLPHCDGLVARITLPAGVREIFLCSDSAIPADIHGGRDARRLGLQLAALVADDGLHWRREIACTDERLVDGFHAHEGTLRWTDGRARLPSELWHGARDMFVLRLAFAAPALPRWVAPAIDSTGRSRNVKLKLLSRAGRTALL